jgi:hypothetical protein
VTGATLSRKACERVQGPHVARRWKQVKRNPLRFRSRCWLWTKGCVWFTVWGAPLGAAGIALCIPVITAPIGLFLIWLAALPLANMIEKRGKEVNEWRESPVPGVTEAKLPWSTPQLTDAPWNER